MEFTLEDIDVGLTAAEIEDAVRPVLQDQSAEMANYLLGDYRENSGPVDFFYQRDEDGTPALHFIAASDRPEGAPYDWDKPGFYEDEGLTAKLSRASDGVHEVWVPPIGESTIFIQDDTGALYRLRVFVSGESARDEITVLIAKTADPGAE